MSAEWGMGMGMMLLAMTLPSSLMAAMKAGTRTAWGDCMNGGERDTTILSTSLQEIKFR